MRCTDFSNLFLE